MKLILSLSAMALANLISIKPAQATHNLDAERDTNRIEYQIPMDSRTLRGDSEGQLKEFLDHLDSLLEDNMFQDLFFIRKDSTKHYFRSDRTIAVENRKPKTNSAPKISDIKYRQSINMDWNEKYQNDLTWSMSYSDTCKNTTATADYEHIFTEKVESNMFPDTCEMGNNEMENSDYLTDGGLQYAAKLKFDDDKDNLFGKDDSDAVQVISEEQFTAFGSFDCVNSGFNDYFTNFCRKYANTDGLLVTTDKSVYNLVMDSKFEVYYHNQTDQNATLHEFVKVSKGKLLFQVRFDTMNDWSNDWPTGRETELSIKAYRDNTDVGMCGEGQTCWEYTVDLLARVTDAAVQCGYPWVRYEGCDVNDVHSSCPTAAPSLAPTHSPGYVPMCCLGKPTVSEKKGKKCANSFEERTCVKGKRKRHCRWTTC